MKKITLLLFTLTAYFGFSQATHTIDFEPAGVGSGWSWTASDNAPSFAEITNPVSGSINTSATVVEFIAYTTDQNWALCWTDENNQFTFDATNSTVKIMVYKPTISNVAIKFEGVSAAIELNVPNTLINQWEELTFDFSGQIGNTYNRLVVIPDFVTPYVTGQDRTTDNTLYFDNIQLPEGVIVETCSDGVMNQDETGIDCGGVCAPCVVLPPDAPNPGTPDGEVLSIYSDTGGFTNVWTPDYTFGGFTGKPDLDTTTGVDEAIQMDFSNLGYGEGRNAQVDVSAYNWVHFDYFAPNIPAGVSGHQVRFILIGDGIGEFNYEMTTGGSDGTLVFDSWQSVDIPLSFFEGLGWTKTNYFQFKLGTESDLNTTIVYFDNIYFSVNQGVLGVNDFETTDFSVYPNPSNNVWNVKTNNTIINSIQVFDVLGKQVLSLNPRSVEAQIDASTLNTGLYFAKIETDTGINSIKLIKN